MAEIIETGTTFAAAAGAAAPSPFTPDFTGRLIGVRILSSRQAATSLINAVQITINCSNFKPNKLEFCVIGTGLQTAPASPVNQTDYEVDQPILAIPITIQSRHTYANAVTPDILVMGLFEMTD